MPADTEIATDEVVWLRHNFASLNNEAALVFTNLASSVHQHQVVEDSP